MIWGRSKPSIIWVRGCLSMSAGTLWLSTFAWQWFRPLGDLRHYMTEYSVLLVSRLDPLRYLFDRPVLTGRLMRWMVLLTEFDIHYVTQKSVKGSIVADHLASLPISNDWYYRIAVLLWWCRQSVGVWHWYLVDITTGWSYPQVNPVSIFRSSSVDE